MSSPPSPSPPIVPVARHTLGGPASTAPDVFGPKVLVPETPKRARESIAANVDTPASTTSSVAAGASPRKKNKGTKKPAISGEDVDTMDVGALRALLKTTLVQLEQSQLMNKKLSAALAKLPVPVKQISAPAVVAAPIVRQAAAATAQSGPTVITPPAAPLAAAGKAAVPFSDPAPALAPGHAPKSLMSQEEAWTIVKPRYKRHDLRAQPLCVIYLAIGHTRMPTLRPAFRALGIDTREIRDYAFVRANTLQVLVPVESRDRMVASFRAAKIAVFDKFDATRPASASASEAERDYAWSRFLRVADSGIEHARKMDRPGVAAFYEEWKRRESARRTATVASVAARPSSALGTGGAEASAAAEPAANNVGTTAEPAAALVEGQQPASPRL
ncbi:hypothetical protein OC835_003217 [Tilletia horrida]|nr:hypothetical protein OC835_003217 [Tilletia horrida]